MKILLVTIDFLPGTGGVAHYLENLARQLPAGAVTILAPAAADATDADFPQTIVRRRLQGRWRLFRWWPLYWQIGTQLWRGKFDLLWLAQPLPVGVIGRRLARWWQIPYVVNTHGMDVAGPLSRGGRHARQLRQVLRGAALVTANSQFTAGLVRQCGVSEEKIQLLLPCPRPAVAVDLVMRETLLAKLNVIDEPIVLAAGRLVARKGFDIILSAWPQIRREVPSARLVIAGDGPQAADLLHSSQGLAGVQFVGRVNAGELAALYDACTCLVMPARVEAGGDVEGFGMVFLEANSYGKPVVAGDTGGQPEAVLDQETGFVVAATDPAAVAGAVVRLLTEPALAARLGQAGQARVARDFRWANRARDFYQRLTAIVS